MDGQVTYHIAIDTAGSALCGAPQSPFTGRMALPENAFHGEARQRERIASAVKSGEMCAACVEALDTEVHIIPDALADAPIALCGKSADMCGDVVAQADIDDGLAVDALCAECDSAANERLLAYLAGVGSHRAKRALGQVDG